MPFLAQFKASTRLTGDGSRSGNSLRRAPILLPGREPGNQSVARYSVKFMLLIYNDSNELDALPPTQFDSMMRDCLTHADELRADGQLLESQQLESPSTAKSVRIRKGRLTVTDGPFAEAKEVLVGFNLIEADTIEEAVEIAATFPWARTGCVEVRPVRDIGAVRARVGAPSSEVSRR